MHVHWLEQTESDVPASEEWLSASEALHLRDIAVAKRRNDWRLGRWTAKKAWATYLKAPPDPQIFREIEIRPAPSGAPVLFFNNNPEAVTISLSHRDGTALCAIAPSGGALGCDLEVVEPRSDAFLADYFTAEEQALVAHASAEDRSRLLALLWSGKESALKALREGLRLDTRCVIVSVVDGLGRGVEDGAASMDYPSDSSKSSCSLNGWRPLHVRHTEGQSYHGWWRQSGDLVRTVVAAPPPDSPIFLGSAILP
jgi:4'-phosphopantetheinyl transferase